MKAIMVISLACLLLGALVTGCTDQPQTSGNELQAPTVEKEHWLNQAGEYERKASEEDATALSYLQSAKSLAWEYQCYVSGVRGYVHPEYLNKLFSQVLDMMFQSQLHLQKATEYRCIANQCRLMAEGSK